jgi:hypothetical protein
MRMEQQIAGNKKQNWVSFPYGTGLLSCTIQDTGLNSMNKIQQKYNK